MDGRSVYPEGVSTVAIETWLRSSSVMLILEAVLTASVAGGPVAGAVAQGTVRARKRASALDGRRGRPRPSVAEPPRIGRGVELMNFDARNSRHVVGE